MVTMSTPRRALLLAPAIVSLALVTGGCGRIQDAAQNQVDNAVSEATAKAGDAVEGQVSEQVQSAVDSALAGIDTTCADFLDTPATEQSALGGALLQVFWAAELSVEAAPQEVVDAYSAALVGGCEATPDAGLTSVAQTAYDSGQYPAPQG